MTTERSLTTSRSGATPADVESADVAQARLKPAPRPFVPHRPKWHGEIAAWLIYGCGTALSRTWRIRWHDESGCFTGKEKGPLIFAIWHNRLALAPSFCRYGFARRESPGAAALISASKDGALLARTLEHLGLSAARGSSSRRGAQAFLELSTWIKKGYHVAITPDGPRGPKYRIHDGILALAQLTSTAIVPVGAEVRGKYVFKSWDAFQLPLPFARVDMYFGKPISVPRDLSEEGRRELAAQLASAMEPINRD